MQFSGPRKGCVSVASKFALIKNHHYFKVRHLDTQILNENISLKPTTDQSLIMKSTLKPVVSCGQVAQCGDPDFLKVKAYQIMEIPGPCGIRSWKIG